LTVGGIIALIIFALTIGTDLLINFAGWLNKVKDGSETKISRDDTQYVAPPVFNAMNPATNSAQIIVSGYANSKQIVKIYVNGKLATKTDIKDNRTFSATIPVDKGQNEIKAKAVTEKDKESSYSSVITVSYLDKQPALDLTFPQDGQSVSKGDSPIKITGKTDSGVKVTVNDFWAITNDDGTFTYMLSLHDGDNAIKVVATDDAGNKTTKEITIKVQ